MSRALTADLPRFTARVAVELEELPPDAARVEHMVAAMPAVHRANVAQRIAAGDVCWIGRVAGEVVYQAWVGIGSTYSYTLDRRYPLNESDTTVYGAYTVPTQRDQGIHSVAVAQILAVLRDRGMKRVITLMEPDNPAALRMTEKLGFATVGYTGFVEIAGVRFHFMRDRGFFPHVRPRNYWLKV